MTDAPSLEDALPIWDSLVSGGNPLSGDVDLPSPEAPAPVIDLSAVNFSVADLDFSLQPATQSRAPLRVPRHGPKSGGE